MTEILSCPFCGSEGTILLDDSSDYPSFWEYIIRCDGDGCYVEQSGKTEADAIAAWNRRAAPPAPAVEQQVVDYIDVTGWGVFKGHAIPVAVARFIAEKINLYYARCSALAAPAEGWRLVPIKPTEAMRAAAFDVLEIAPGYMGFETGTHARNAVYRAMIDAAPSAPSGEASCDCLTFADTRAEAAEADAAKLREALTRARDDAQAQSRDLRNDDATRRGANYAAYLIDLVLKIGAAQAGNLTILEAK